MVSIMDMDLGLDSMDRDRDDTTSNQYCVVAAAVVIAVLVVAVVIGYGSNILLDEVGDQQL